MISHTLTRHRDIRNWAAGHNGMPAIRRVPNRFGQIEPRLELMFARMQQGRHRTPSVDDGMSPVSWSAWLAELDRRQLALRVSDRPEPAVEFVARQDQN